jgi:hypothetical protein
MAATETENSSAPYEQDTELEAAEPIAGFVGPLRDPDGCVLACADCTCRRLLEERRRDGAPG